MAAVARCLLLQSEWSVRISVYLSVGHIRELSLAKTTAPINMKGRPGGRGQGTIVLDWGSRYSHVQGQFVGVVRPIEKHW